MVTGYYYTEAIHTPSSQHLSECSAVPVLLKYECIKESGNNDLLGKSDSVID